LFFSSLKHTEAQNSWWGRSGGGAPTFTSRRHNVQNVLEKPRQKWVGLLLLLFCFFEYYFYLRQQIILVN